MRYFKYSPRILVTSCNIASNIYRKDLNKVSYNFRAFRLNSWAYLYYIIVLSITITITAILYSYLDVIALL